MYNAGKIFLGLGIFLVVVTFPVWYDNVVSAKATTQPETKIITTEKECVAPTPYMKASHMELLDDWRETVVRQGERVYVSASGRHHEMSLTRTCLNCHSNKSEFCDRCHTFMAVTPYCYDCHVPPQEVVQ